MSAAAVESTRLFDIRTTAARYGRSSEEVANWLRKGGYPLSPDRPAVFTSAAYQRLLQFLEEGAACQFNGNPLPTEQELRRQRNVLGRDLHRLRTSYTAQKKTIAY